MNNVPVINCIDNKTANIVGECELWVLETINNMRNLPYQILCLMTLQITWFTNHINWIFLFLSFMHQSVEYDSSIERFRTNVSHRSPRRYYVQLRKQDKYRKSSKRIPYKHYELTKSLLLRIISINSWKTKTKCL